MKRNFQLKINVITCLLALNILQKTKQAKITSAKRLILLVFDPSDFLFKMVISVMRCKYVKIKVIGLNISLAIFFGQNVNSLNYLYVLKS